MWTPLEKVQSVAWFIETKSDAQVQRNVLAQYRREPPSPSTIWVRHTSFMETGSFRLKLGAGEPSVSGANVAFGYGILSLRTTLHDDLSPVASTFFVKSASTLLYTTAHP
ncbi:hypothetical protein AVEN_166951-1 [Araneus ventricosus]|uniref:Uncharacterized protein n=1 Tax=Araneus ventricosus TaxID=182803 RepID=A0A4Y2T0I2_ARAVE|nr:hypothetical protein AVEN_166951-1 [Araneus ventricosus]